MGDKSPKAKNKHLKQKDAAKTQAKSDQQVRQAGYASTTDKDKKK